MKTDVLIVGAGFAGMVMAERLSSIGKRCVIVEKRDHIGGNAYDYYNEAGVLVHKYGPHFFHTNSDKVFQYLSRFTEWIPAYYTARSFVDGVHYSFPPNLKTYEQMEQIGKSRADVMAMFFTGYSRKQWGFIPPAEVIKRIPLRDTYDSRYFDDTYQVMPRDGYATMFRRMMDSCLCPGDSLLCHAPVFLNTAYKKLDCRGPIVFTGSIDEYFDYCYGRLPYRTVRFEQETFNERFHQPTPIVCYPGNEPFTRKVEIKHVTGQKCPNTTVVTEYPEQWEPGKERLYPMPTKEAAALYAKYKALADKERNVTFLGRLGTYKYFNMDQVVAQALAAFERLKDTL